MFFEILVFFFDFLGFFIGFFVVSVESRLSRGVVVGRRVDI